MEMDKLSIGLNGNAASHFDSNFESSAPEPIAITKGMPAPQKRRSKYPFREMELGDSFFAPGVSVIGIHGCARRHRPMRFTCRSVTESGTPGVRVWRIA